MTSESDSQSMNQQMLIENLGSYVPLQGFKM